MGCEGWCGRGGVAFAPIGYLIWAVMGWVPTYPDAIFGVVG